MKWQGKIVEIYDLWWSKHSNEELPFWKEICSKHLNQFSKTNEPRIVELCGGTGRILLPLIESLKEKYPNIKGISIDYSPEMNQFLIDRMYSMNLSNSIEVIEYDLSLQDWSSVLNENSVDIILFPFNHFELVGDKAMQENIVKNISRCLKIGGIFISDNFNPIKRLENSTGQKELRRIITDPKNENRVLFYWRQQTQLDNECRYALVTYCIECIEWLNGGLHIQSLPATMKIRFLYNEELKELFNNYQLRVLKEYGTYQYEKVYGPDSKKRIIIAEKY